MAAGICHGQTPVDSLYATGELNLGMQVILKPIQLWQHLSYHTPALNCQFEESCSNYMVEAIMEKGVLSGFVMGTDRIVRCNPAARRYHLKLENPIIQADGRLVEPLNLQARHGPGKNPYLALSLSVVPGLGRAYSGHPVDGLFSFIFVAGFSFNSAMQARAGNTVSAGAYGMAAGLFWIADFYGAYRTARLAVTSNK